MRTAAPTYRREWMGYQIEALRKKMAYYDDRIRRAAKFNNLSRVDAWLTEVSTDAGVRQIQREVRKILVEARSYVRDWVKRYMPDAYQIGTEVSVTNLKKAGVAVEKIARTHLNASAVNYAIEQMDGDMGQAVGSISQKLNRMFREMHVTMKQSQAFKRSLLTDRFEKMADKEIVNAIANEEGYREIAQRMFQRFQKDIGAGLVRIVGPSGKPRNYDLKSYTEMVARTRLRETVVQGSKNTLIENAFDFVEVTAYGTDCEICSEYEGNIYSLSGEGELDNAEFQGALTDEDEPPYHPNCTHTLIPYIPSEDEVVSDPTGTFEEPEEETETEEAEA